MSRTISKQLLNQIMATTGLEDDEIQTWLSILRDLADTDQPQFEELRQWLNVHNHAIRIIKNQPFFRR